MTNLFTAALMLGWLTCVVKLARVDSRAKETIDMNTDEPAIAIDRVVPLIGEDICVLDSHDRYTGRIYRVILPRTPGKPLYYDYDFWAACLCGERVTYPESRKTT